MKPVVILPIAVVTMTETQDSINNISVIQLLQLVENNEG
jgi:hypothetical protein